MNNSLQKPTGQTPSQEIFHNISRNNNMGIVRYVLCLIVITMHTHVLTGNELPDIPFDYVAVGGFFALSGFLLFASFQRRPTLKHYLSRRARRILPPYFLIVVACALGLVSISSLSPAEYFTNSGLYKYLIANISFMNFLHNELPGVFQGENFIFHTVNGSLWTMKGEWICYLSIPVLFMIIAGNRRRAIYVLVSLILLCISANYTFLELVDHTGKNLYGIIAKQFGNLYLYFFCGGLINIFYPQFLKYKWPILGFIIAVWTTADYNPLYYLVFQPIIASMLVIWVSQVGRWATFLKNHDDLSYDMYLFHFPIIQLTIIWGWPAMMPPYVLLSAVIIISFALALLSWNILGKHILHPKTSK